MNIAEKSVHIGHWICIRVGNSSVEIFDSLGYEAVNWGFKSPSLTNFVQNFRTTHSIYASPRLQSSSSSICGFYCIFYIFYRKSVSFASLLNFFTQNLQRNDERVMEAVSKVIN